MLSVLLALRFQNSKISGKRNRVATRLDHIHMPSPKAQLFLLEALASNIVYIIVIRKSLMRIERVDP